MSCFNRHRLSLPDTRSGLHSLLPSLCNGCFTCFKSVWKSAPTWSIHFSEYKAPPALNYDLSEMELSPLYLMNKFIDVRSPTYIQSRIYSGIFETTFSHCITSSTTVWGLQSLMCSSLCMCAHPPALDHTNRFAFSLIWSWTSTPGIFLTSWECGWSTEDKLCANTSNHGTTSGECATCTHVQ